MARPHSARLLPALLALLAVAGGGVVTSGASFTSATTAPASTVSAAADWLAPIVSVTDPQAALHGTVALGVDASDSGSGVASVTLQRSAAGADSWSTVCADTSAPYGCDMDTTTLPDGLYDLRAIATDGAANGATSDVLTDVEVDNTAPTVAMEDPGSPLSDVVTLTASAGDAQSGVANVTIFRSPAGAGAWTAVCVNTIAPYTCGFDTTALADGLYDLRAVAVDAAGNTMTSATVAGRRVDNTVPAVTLDDPGASLRGTVTLTATASSSSGVSSVTFQRAAAGGATWTTICTDETSPYSCAWDTPGIANGSYDLRAVMTTGSGATVTSATVSARTIDNSAVHGVDVQAANAVGTTAGRLNAGDRLSLTYSRPMHASTLITGWTGIGPAALYVRVVDARTLGATADGLFFSVDVTGLVATGLGTVGLGAGNFVAKGRTTVFAATASLSTTTVNGVTASVVTITLGAALSGSGNLQTSGAGVMTWNPSAAAKDTTGIASSTTAATESGSTDVDF